MKILTVIGARPQFIKAASISRFIQTISSIEEVIVHTGQHHDANMSDIFFEEMEIPKPKYHLGIGSLSHGAMTGRMIESIEKTLLIEKPDLVLIYGDTNSTLAAAISSVKLNIPIAHVEAGLRSYNWNMPEEINRIVSDQLSKYLFCPTENAIQNLKQEGYDNFNKKIIYSGDVMFDAVIYYKSIALKKSNIIKKFNLKEHTYTLATIHRAETTDNQSKLSSIIDSLNEISKINQVVCPIHPRTKKQIISNNLHVSFLMIDPIGYFGMLRLLENCNLVITDSGGLQKEAYFFQKPCITVREETEWIELVKCGVNQLVGTDRKSIIKSYQYFLTESIKFPIELYGNGKASEIIISSLLNQ